ncbi:MAG: membrane protein insertase YidC [Duodenibacillus sp.]|nr:membrane protein insertase YidC [Duodenibacillus sp.]
MRSDFQRTILWVILAASCFMLWDNWQIYNGRPSFFGPNDTVQRSAEAGAAAKADAGQVPAAAGAGSGAIAKGMAVKPAHPVVLKNDLLELDIAEEGAVVTRATLLKEKQQAEWTDVGLAGLVLGNQAPEPKPIELFKVSDKHVYVAQSGLIGGDFPNHKTQFKCTGAGQSVVCEATQGTLQLRKTYELENGRYGVKVTHEAFNKASVATPPVAVYYQLMRDGGKPEGESSFYYTYTGPAVYTEKDKFQKIKFDDIGDRSDMIAKADNGWVAMVQHYFVSSWTDLRGDASKVPHEFYTRKLDENLYSVGTIKQFAAIEPGQSLKTEAVLYVGPQDQRRLGELADGLDLVVDYGWLTFLAKPIYQVLNFLHSICGNWGWAIVLLTCLVKALLYPVSAAGYKSMARMKEVTPRMKALQEQYGSDKQRYQQALMDLYKKEKINPVGGCLPIALQIPVFLALYWVLLASVELRGSEWMLWVTDLAMPDPWFILPAVMMITMLLQIKLNPTPTDPMQQKMMVIMPLVFGVMFFFFASGLVLYWFTNNVLSILQQWYVNKSIAEERAKRLAAAANG